MMPDPILALVSFVGLLTYSAIGAVVGTFTVRLFSEVFDVGDIKKLAGKSTKSYDNSWAGFGFAVVLWPAVAALAAAAGVLAGPVIISHRIGRYIATAQLKES